MKKFFCWIVSLWLLFPARGGANELPPLPKGPLLLTSTTREQLSPEYWIRRIPEPDKVIKTPEELKRFNEDIRMRIKDCVDVFKLDLKKPGEAVRSQIELEYNTLSKRILFGVDGKRVPKTVFEQDIRPLMAWENIPSQVKMKWGVAVRAASVRALPTDTEMIEEVGDVEFDQLQFTLIKLWTPVGIYCASTDGKWLYVQAPYTRGWVKAKDIATFSSRNELKKYAKSKDFLVVTGESIPLYQDIASKKILQRTSMGTVLPLVSKKENAYGVWMPSRSSDGSVSLGKAYVSKRSDVSVGFLSFTQRNVIRQAFKLLGARYGWGGMFGGGRDCSGFSHDVFLTVGVDMPRNSKPQTFVGTQINHFEPFENSEGKKAALRSVMPGLTILRMPHHIMLYLGEVDGKFYAIHSTWAERISMTSDEKNRINQVVVTDLSLNGASRVGSLFDRIISISEVND